MLIKRLANDVSLHRGFDYQYSHIIVVIFRPYQNFGLFLLGLNLVARWWLIDFNHVEHFACISPLIYNSDTQTTESRRFLPSLACRSLNTILELDPNPSMSCTEEALRILHTLSLEAVGVRPGIDGDVTSVSSWLCCWVWSGHILSHGPLGDEWSKGPDTGVEQWLGPMRARVSLA